MPPDGSAGKNFRVRRPISIACSTKLGLLTPGMIAILRC
ncbi:Uncharacterised protein [Vibrio cholerae]|nr:Uncharacterised protein [Vibrio cholerae]